MRKFVVFASVIMTFVLTGCGPKISIIKNAQLHSQMYTSKPLSILVLPAKNTTTAAEATDYFRSTITQPLAEKGYYVFPVHLVDAFLKSENMIDPEIIRQIPISKLKEVFGADAILYVDINAWDTGYNLIGSHVDVGLTFSLVDTRSEEEIWQKNAYAYSYQGLDGNNGIIGLIVSAMVTAINTGTDYGELAYVANRAGFAFLPEGPYGTDYMKDANISITLHDPGKLKDGRLYVSKYFIKGLEKEEPVPLTVRSRQKGYFALVPSNYEFFNHNGYSNYYITQKTKNGTFLRNRFFEYTGGFPYLICDNKKVYVEIEADGIIPYSEKNGEYYFNIREIVELEDAVEG
ncbi:MAG TPA: hypothetical protein ENN33_02190 [Ignavibacteria bacterium]|nr:hypothetical protein [Ignavibacteria bacterium]